MALRLKDPNPDTETASGAVLASSTDVRAGSPTRVVVVLAFGGSLSR